MPCEAKSGTPPVLAISRDTHGLRLLGGVTTPWHAVTHAVALTPLHTGGVTAIRPRLSVLLGVILSRAEAATAPTAQHHHPHTHRTLSHVRSPARSLRLHC